MKNNHSIIKQITKEHLKANLFDNGVIEIVWDISIKEIEVIHLKEMQQTVCELGEGKKMSLHFSMHEFLGITPEARKYATSEEGVMYTLATTVLVDNLAKKMLFNFFMNVNKPIVPTKGFSNKEDAFLWLENLLQQQFVKRMSAQ